MVVVESDLLAIPEAHELEALDTAVARDLVIDCFSDVQKHSRLRRALPVQKAAIRENVIDTAISIMKRNGDDFQAPTSRGLIHLVAGLVLKAHNWGAPQEVLNHHTAQLGRLFDHFEELD